jgi:hypothetical protein
MNKERKFQAFSEVERSRAGFALTVKDSQTNPECALKRALERQRSVAPAPDDHDPAPWRIAVWDSPRLDRCLSRAL